MVDDHGEKKGEGQPTEFQESPPTSSRIVHPYLHEVKQRWQEAYMDAQEAQP